MYVPTPSAQHAELRQGDIFAELPWPLFDPCDVGSESGPLDISITGFANPQPLLVFAEPATGVIVSADCACARDELLELCRVQPITVHDPGFNSKSQVNQLKLKIKLQRKVGIFYLRPFAEMPDSFLEFSDKLVLPRAFLLKYRRLRLTTLHEEARHHLREKLAHHQTRFGPDESYIFSEEEIRLVIEHKILDL